MGTNRIQKIREEINEIINVISTETGEAFDKEGAEKRLIEKQVELSKLKSGDKNEQK